MKRLYLFDANSLIHRAFHALPPLTNKKGEPIQAVYGVSTILLKLWKEDRPDYAAALFDLPGKTFRDEMYEEYKAHRAETASELVSQLTLMPELFSCFGIRCFSEPGYEADDLIATFVERFKKEKDLEITILTGDMDTLQLVQGKKVAVRAFRKGVSETALFDEAGVKERYGLSPEQMVDYKSLVGDVSDNVKGVPGIGPKTAAHLLQSFGSLEGALKKLPEGSRIRERLLTADKEITLSRNLVELKRDIPVMVSLEGLKLKPDFGALAEYFESQGFKTLLLRLLARNDTPIPKKSRKSSSGPQGQML